MPRGVGPICRPPTGQVPKPTLPASLLNSPRDSQRVQSRDRLNRAIVGTGHRTGVRNSTRGRDRVLQRILGHTSRMKNTLRNLHIRRTLHLRGIRRHVLHGIRDRILHDLHRVRHDLHRVRPLHTMPGRKIRSGVKRLRQERSFFSFEACYTELTPIQPENQDCDLPDSLFIRVCTCNNMAGNR